MQLIGHYFFLVNTHWFCLPVRVRQVNGIKTFTFFDKQINELATEGWAIKFSNMSVVQEDPASHAKEPLVAFYDLLEREKER